MTKTCEQQKQVWPTYQYYAFANAYVSFLGEELKFSTNKKNKQWIITTFSKTSPIHTNNILTIKQFRPGTLWQYNGDKSFTHEQLHVHLDYLAKKFDAIVEGRHYNWATKQKQSLSSLAASSVGIQKDYD